MAYINQSAYKSKFDGLTPATPQWDAVWTGLGNTDATNFAADQHAYIKANYYDVYLSKLKTAGMDLSKFGPAVSDLCWSISVQLRTNGYINVYNPIS